MYNVKNILVKSEAKNISYLENTEKELSSLKAEVDIDEVPFESQVSEVYDVKNILVKSEVESCHSKLCGEGLKGSGCYRHVCKMALENLDNDVKNVNHLENSGQGLNEGLSIKEEIDIDEIPFESQVNEVYDKNILVKSEVESHHCKLCGERLKGSECYSHVCKLALGNRDNDTKDVSCLENSEQGFKEGLCIKEEIDTDEIPFESQVSEEF